MKQKEIHLYKIIIKLINFSPVHGNNLSHRGQVYHFFLCSSIDTPPGPSDTIINKPPMTESVCKNKIIIVITVGEILQVYLYLT